MTRTENSVLPAVGLLEPWRPSREQPFDLRRAGHLFRRAVGGVDLSTRQLAVRRGLRWAMRRVFGARGDRVDAFASIPVVLDRVEHLRAFRVWRLCSGPEPFVDRLTMFWHDHFATSHDKVQDVGAMSRQLQLFDKAGAGRFQDLLLAVARDPAMIRWLDNDSNHVGKPNENLARELLELFTMGVRSGYTEMDVREAARALTGRGVRDGRCQEIARQHDGGSKTVLGVTGNLTGDDVVRIAGARPETARTVATKLLAYYVHPEPSDAAVDVVAARFTALDGHVGNLLRELLASRLFFAESSVRCKVKDPLDWTVGHARTLGARIAPMRLAEAAADLGLAIASPPSVEGWHRERAWLTSSTWIRRVNFAAETLVPAGEHALEGVADEPEALAATAIDAVLDGDADDAARAKVLAAVRSAPRSSRRRTALQAVFLLPQSQLL